MTKLTRSQLNLAVNELIIAEFPGVKIESRDLEEGFDRPSFHVSVESTQTSRSLSDWMREITCRVRFFPTSRHIYKEEAYDTMDRLEKVFGLNFLAGGHVLTINEARPALIDGVVHFDFDFTLQESIEEDGPSNEEMQELEFNG